MSMTEKGERMTPQGENAMKPTGNEDIWHFNLSELKPGKEFILENKETWEQASLRGTTHEMSTENFHLWYGNLSIDEARQIWVKYHEPVVHLHFSIRSASHYHPATQKTITLHQHQHNILALPGSRIKLKWEEAEKFESFVISAQPAVFLKYLPQNHHFFKALRQNLSQDKAVCLSESGLPITPEITGALFEILNCTLKGYFRKVYVEAKIAEVMALQLGQLDALDAPVTLHGLKKEDLEKMYRVRELLVSDLGNTLTLRQLSHEVGTNEHSLKINFKKVFGNTVFGYLHDYRMEKSLKMLKKGNATIADTAQRIGYKHATHFTAAFKKYFGFLPTKINGLLINFLYLLEDFSIEAALL